MPESTSMPPTAAHSVSSGLSGLDRLLGGGFIEGRAYQVRGRPGAGKTILGWHFLTEPFRTGEDGSGSEAGSSEPEGSALLITFDEPAGQLRTDAARLGFDPDPVRILDLSPTSGEFSEQGNGGVVLPADVGLGPVTEKVTAAVEETPPSRIVVDSMSHFRYLSADAAQHRNRALAFLRYLKEREATILLLSEHRSGDSEENLHYLSDGILELSRSERHRTVQVVKQRGQEFRPGAHSVSIGEEGMEVHPRLEPLGPQRQAVEETLSSGVPELDELLGGGVEQQTVTMISGASGVGKTTLGLQFMKEAAGRGQRSVLFSFEEEEGTLLRRSADVNIPAREMISRGTLSVQQCRPWSFDAGVFASDVRREVEEEGTQILMIDGLKGYWECGGADRLRDQLHRLCKYLVGKGVTVLLVNETRNVTGDFQVTERRVSHLADSLIFLRYLEMGGEVRKAIGNGAELAAETGMSGASRRRFGSFGSAGTASRSGSRFEAFGACSPGTPNGPEVRKRRTGRCGTRQPPANRSRRNGFALPPTSPLSDRINAGRFV
ncbi:MAG: ATPase domain-containing protein [Salinibacter sp.]